MPTFPDPLSGVSHSEALKEAWTHADTSVAILATLELLHPSFLDDAGSPTSARVVADFQELSATLEADAPMNPGETVTFYPVPFEFTRPAEGEGTPGDVTLSVDNVSRELSDLLAMTAGSMTPITVIVREYLSSDTSAPHTDPPLTLTLTGAKSTIDRVTATANFGALTNTRFPRDRYDSVRFPGLSAR